MLHYILRAYIRNMSTCHLGEKDDFFVHWIVYQWTTPLAINCHSMIPLVSVSLLRPIWFRFWMTAWSCKVIYKIRATAIIMIPPGIFRIVWLLYQKYFWEQTRHRLIHIALQLQFSSISDTLNFRIQQWTPVPIAKPIEFRGRTYVALNCVTIASSTGLLSVLLQADDDKMRQMLTYYQQQQAIWLFLSGKFGSNCCPQNAIFLSLKTLMSEPNYWFSKYTLKRMGIS